MLHDGRDLMTASPIRVFVHFHKEFPFNFDSSWMQATGDGVGYPEPRVTNVLRAPRSVLEFRKYYHGISDDDFLAALGALATEFWLLHQTPDVEYVGCTTYRRYLLIDSGLTNTNPVLTAEANMRACTALSSDAQRDAALAYLQSADVLTNRGIVLNCSIAEQYVTSHPALHWHLFLEAIDSLLPDYRRHLMWFSKYNIAGFFTCYIMRRDLFRKYAAELFMVLEHVIRHAPQVFPDKVEGARMQAFRYPGFLGERFLPFFLYANGVRKLEFPQVLLDPREGDPIVFRGV